MDTDKQIFLFPITQNGRDQLRHELDRRKGIFVSCPIGDVNWDGVVNRH